MSIALSLLTSLAFANELTQPAVGASSMTVDGCASTVVASPWNTKNAGRLAIDQATAAKICAEAKGNLAIAEAKAKAIVDRAPAEAQLIRDSGMALVVGRNVEVVTPEGLTVRGGDHLEWQAYGEAVSRGNPGLYAPGMMPAGGDPNLYRLSGGSMGMLYGPTPAIPGQVAPAATAPCGTAQECQATIDAQASAMAAADK